jgi:hypothetical protein
LSFSDFGTSGQRQEFTIDFTVKRLQRWEFREYAYSNNTYVALDYINVKLLGP